MKIKDTFSLSETHTKEFWDKVLYVEKWHSSGLGGPGALWMITSDKLLFQIGFETFPYDEHHLEEFSDFFAEEEYDRVNFKRVYRIEKYGWKHLPAHQFSNDIWIKDEFVDEFIHRYKDATTGNRYVFCPQLFAEIIGVNVEIERVIEEKFADLLEKEHRRREMEERERERVKMCAEHFSWKPLYMNNMKSMPQIGEYALLFKQSDNKVLGYKFSITYQMPMIEPMVVNAGEKPEMYILYVKRYEEVVGTFKYPDLDVTCNCENSFNEFDINDIGEFQRAFMTIEAAKEFATAIATRRYQITSNNLFVP